VTKSEMEMTVHSGPMSRPKKKRWIACGNVVGTSSGLLWDEIFLSCFDGCGGNDADDNDNVVARSTVEAATIGDSHSSSEVDFSVSIDEERHVFFW